MKLIFKPLLLILASIIIIYFMAKNDFFHLDYLKEAFISHRKVIYLIFGLQSLGYFLMALRYFSLLKIFNLNVDFKNVTAATFVSNGLGIWMPGSMAFIEIIRIALMLGAENKFNNTPSEQTPLPNEEIILLSKEQLSVRSRLTTVSLFDRLIGLWAMLFIGLVVIANNLFFSFKKISTNYESVGLLFIFLFTLILLIFISFLPILSRNIILRKIFSRIERFFLIWFRQGIVHKFLKRIFLEINSLLDAISIGSKKYNQFLVPFLYSFLCVFIQAIGTYYCAIAISSHIPFYAILATVSILAIATLIPMGFGGIGGVQFVAAISMSIFGVLPQSAASAQLLQTAINLMTISLIGLLFSKLSFQQIKSAFKIYTLKTQKK